MKLFAIVSAMLLSAAAGLQAGSIYEIPLTDIDGQPASLKAYEGKVLLIVNVASRCGHTPQYKALQALYQRYQDKGLVILGFPCNQFAEQEPGTNTEIKNFCSSTYHVTFPLFDKVKVNGPDRHPLYDFLAGKQSPFPGDIKWNFDKFLVGRNGKILLRADSFTVPDSNRVIAAIEGALAAR